MKKLFKKKIKKKLEILEISLLAFSFSVMFAFLIPLKDSSMDFMIPIFIIFVTAMVLLYVLTLLRKLREIMEDKR